MRTVPASLAAEYVKTTTTLARGWVITRRDGVIFRFTDFQRDITVGGDLFTAAGGADPSAMQSSEDTAVGNMEMGAVFDSAAITEADLDGGKYDGASVEVVHFDWKNPVDTFTIFTGTTGRIRRDDHTYSAELLSSKQKLMRQYGRTHQERCDVENLGDARCMVVVADFTFTGAVTGVTDSSLFSGDTSQATGYFNYGVVTFTSGLNNGISKEVGSHTNGDNFSMFEAFPYTIAVGDTYSAEAGCDRRASICKSRFSNLVNFRGFAAVDSGGNDIPIIPGNTKINKRGGR